MSPLPDAGGDRAQLADAARDAAGWLYERYRGKAGQDAMTLRRFGDLFGDLAQALASLSPRAGEEGDQGLRASRDHDQTAGVALDWRPISEFVTRWTPEAYVVVAIVFADGAVGEAEYHGEDDGWWWANTHHEYHADKIHPTHGMEMPSPPSSATGSEAQAEHRDEQSPKAPAKLEGES